MMNSTFSVFLPSGAVQFLEILLRVSVGHIKPVTFSHTLHGAIQNHIYAPLAVIMLMLSLWSGMRSVTNAK